MKIVGMCKVINAEPQEFADKQTGEIQHMTKCTALTDDSSVVIFYRREPVKVDDTFQMILATDSKLKAVIRYQIEE